MNSLQKQQLERNIQAMNRKGTRLTPQQKRDINHLAKKSNLKVSLK